MFVGVGVHLCPTWTFVPTHLWEPATNIWCRVTSNLHTPIRSGRPEIDSIIVRKKKLVKRLKWPMFKFGQGLWVQHVSTCFNYACDLCHVGRSFSHPSSEKAMFHQTAPKRPKQHVLPQIGFGTSAPPKKGSGPHLGGSRVAFGQFIVGYKMWTSD